jgi:RES domain-containing protein
MIVYRICKEQYADDLSGAGSRLLGGRWNTKGTAIVYASGTRSLCVLELTMQVPLALFKNDMRVLSIEIPDNLMIDVPYHLPPDWHTWPHHHSSQEIGDMFVKSKKSPVLRVPSAVIMEEFNFLINPSHEDASGIKIVDSQIFSVDSERLLNFLK